MTSDRFLCSRKSSQRRKRFFNSPRGYSSFTETDEDPSRVLCGNTPKASTLVLNPDDTRVHAFGSQALCLFVRLTTWSRFLVEFSHVFLRELLIGPSDDQTPLIRFIKSGDNVEVDMRNKLEDRSIMKLEGPTTNTEGVVVPI